MVTSQTLTNESHHSQNHQTISDAWCVMDTCQSGERNDSPESKGEQSEPHYFKFQRSFPLRGQVDPNHASKMSPTKPQIFQVKGFSVLY